MRRYKIASWIFLILSVFKFALAAPVVVRETHEVRVNAVDVAKVGMAVPEKRMNPGDQASTNAGYLTDESVWTWRTISSDTASSSSSSGELDTAASGASSTGSNRASSTGSNTGPASNPSPPHSVSTDDSPPQSPQPAPDHPPPQSPQPALDHPPPQSPHPAPDHPPPQSPHPAPDHPPPSNQGPSTGPHQLTGDHSLPSSELQHLGAEFENFFGKFMKGKFKRRINHDRDPQT